MSVNRRYRKIYNNDGSARFYAPYHDDFVAELKKFVPENERKWHGDGSFWWITKDYTHVTELICRKFFTEEKPPKRPPGTPPVYGDPDFYSYRAEQVKRDADEAMRNAGMPPFTYFDEETHGTSADWDAWAKRASFFTEERQQRNEEAARKRREEQAKRQEGSNTRPPPSGNFNDWFRQSQEEFRQRYERDPFSGAHRSTGNFDSKEPRPERPLSGDERMTRPLAFQTLQVTSNACPEVLEAAYKALAKKYHPDRPGGDSDKMKRINEAYQMIKR